MEVIEKPANGFEPVHETFTRNLMILKRVRKRLISKNLSALKFIFVGCN